MRKLSCSKITLNKRFSEAISGLKFLGKLIDLVCILSRSPPSVITFWGICAKVCGMASMPSYSMGSEVFMIKIWKKVFFGKLEILKFEKFSLVIWYNYNRIKKISKFGENIFYFVKIYIYTF
jgi:hypothetical protein